MTQRIIFLFSLFAMAFSGYSQENADIKDAADKAQKWFNSQSGDAGWGEEQAAEALKTALEKGARSSVDLASQLDGFFKRPEIKIPFPPEARKVEQFVRRIGLDDQADRFILQLNRAAEQAASAALPIFMKAIRNMSIQDAIGLVKGGNTSATDFLKRKTQSDLREAFRPDVKKVLDQMDIARYWKPLARSYNRSLGFFNRGDKIDPDLESYVLDRTLSGLFYLVAEKEREIRENPMDQAEKILRDVFGGL